MADEANATAPVDAPKAVDESTRPADAPAEPAVVDEKPTDGGDVAKADEAAEDPKPAASEQDTAVAEPTASETKPDTEDAGADADAAAATNGTPASSKKGDNNNRRKSGAGIPEHKKKTPNKKKSAPELHLNVKPGEFWYVAMRGYPPWPVVVCDEQMLPESLLSKRPVSALRIDGTYREDFREGGKNAKDRRYPVMFLGTNEFAWQVNTDLQPLDIDEVKKDVAEGNQGKKVKALWEAYHITAEDHDLDWFKDMLKDHEKAIQDDIEQKAAAKAKKQEKKDKTTKRKSTAFEESDNVDMEDVDEDAAPSAKKAKTTKKRKKESDSDDGESEKPAKTPKTTKLTLKNPKPPKDASASKAKKEKDAKPKKEKAKPAAEIEEAEPAKVEEEPLSEAEKLKRREKSVLYLRHRLQKGFLSRDQAPKEAEMDTMSDYLAQLEALKDLEAEVIKKTKVHKVLKAIIKLDSIPKEDQYSFKKRSSDLLSSWTGALATEGESAVEPASAEPAATNGVKHDENEKAEGPASPTEKTEAEASTELEAAKTDGDNDVLMAEAKEETPAVKADDASNAEAPVPTDAPVETPAA